MKHSQSKPMGAKRKVAPTRAIVRIPLPSEKPWELNTEEVTILKNSVAKGASDNELQFCLTVARRYRLDPFKRQIWFVKRWDKNADNGKGGLGAHVWTPQVGIHGLLHIAGRDHKDFGSVSLPEYGPMQTVAWIDNGKERKFEAPEWAKVKVWKKDVSEPTEAQAWWSEYAPAKLEDAPFWRKMPRRMIGKCAVALGVNEAYPDLGGLLIPEQCERMNEDYTPGGRAIVEREQRGSHEAAQAVAEKQIEEHLKQNPPPPNASLFYTWFEESKTARITGDKQLMTAQRDLLKKHWNATVQAVVVDGETLENLKFQFEQRGVPFKQLKAA